MCLLTFFPDGVVPSDAAIEGLQNGAIFNSDGHGYAIVTGDNIIMRRGLSPTAVIASFVAQRKRFPDGPALFHSRIGTGGGVTKKNCHPFYLGDDRKTVLAHNGILPKLAQPPKGDHRSDTRYLAECLLPEQLFGNPLTCKTDAKLFERWLGPYNKIVILTTNPNYPQSSYVFNMHQGNWEYDAWWSNDSYYPHISYWKTQAYSFDDVPRKRILGEKETCPVCGQTNGVDANWRICWACGYCADCEMSWSKNDCLCYIPGRGGTTKTIGTYPVNDASSTVKPIGILCSTCNRDIVYCDHDHEHYLDSTS